MKTRQETAAGKPGANKLKKNVLAYLMVAPAVLLISVIVAYPILNTILRSFQSGQDDGGYTLEHYLYFFTDKIARANTLYTLGIVVITVMLSIVISFGLALYMRFIQSRYSRLMGIMYLIPRFIPGLVAVNGVITVIRDGGLLNRIGASFGLSLSLGWMFNERGILMMNLWFNIPFATMLIMSSMSGIPDEMIESARDVGAHRWPILLNMIIPLTTKDILIAATFIFMSNIGSFTTPYLMGGNYPQMLGISLFTQFNNMHYERAAALSVLMFLICSLAAAVYIYTNMKDAKWERPE